MTDEESILYEQITEEGEPTSPPMITDNREELWVADHDTGEEKRVIFEGEKDACYHKGKVSEYGPRHMPLVPGQVPSEGC